jgi:hypothetical protein
MWSGEEGWVELSWLWREGVGVIGRGRLDDLRKKRSIEIDSITHELHKWFPMVMIRVPALSDRWDTK